MKVHALVEDLAAARRAVDAGATVVQLRVKGASTGELVERGRGMGALGATFVVNDDVAAAVELGADGVHLGQDDLGGERARVAGLLLGRSVATAAEAAVADADYLGAGPVWSTPSKTDAGAAIGVDGLEAVCAVAEVPVVAIGGIDAANAAQCIAAGAAGVAVIRAAFDPYLREAVDEALRDG